MAPHTMIVTGWNKSKRPERFLSLVTESYAIQSDPSEEGLASKITLLVSQYCGIGKAAQICRGLGG